MSKLLVKDKQRLEKILEVIDGSYELGISAIIVMPIV